MVFLLAALAAATVDASSVRIVRDIPYLTGVQYPDGLDNWTCICLRGKPAFL